MSEYRVGEIVDITIKGARITHVVSNELFYATQAGGTPVEHTLHVGKGWPNHIVERVAPAEWPPQPGDLWRDRDGGLWFAQDDGASDVTPPVMWMVPSAPRRGDDGKQAARLFAGHSPLTLVHREPDGDQS